MSSSKPKKLTVLKLQELSDVNVPAQEGAVITIIKSQDSGSEPAALTDIQGVTMSNIKKSLGLPESATDEQVAEAITKALAERDQNKAALEAAQTVAKGLEEKLTLVETEKAALVTEESFTGFDGKVVKKSVVGASYETIKSLNDKLQETELVAVAKSEYGNLPGTQEETVKLLSIAKKAPKEDGDAIIQLMKAHNELLAQSFVRKGRGENEKDAEKDPEEKLDTLAKNYAEKNSVPFHKAYEAVLNTEEGAELYAQTKQ